MDNLVEQQHIIDNLDEHQHISDNLDEHQHISDNLDEHRDNNKHQYYSESFRLPTSFSVSRNSYVPDM